MESQTWLLWKSPGTFLSGYSARACWAVLNETKFVWDRQTNTHSCGVLHTHRGTHLPHRLPGDWSLLVVQREKPDEASPHTRCTPSSVCPLHASLSHMLRLFENASCAVPTFQKTKKKQISGFKSLFLCILCMCVCLSMCVLRPVSSCPLHSCLTQLNVRIKEGGMRAVQGDVDAKEELDGGRDGGKVNNRWQKHVVSIRSSRRCATPPTSLLRGLLCYRDLDDTGSKVKCLLDGRQAIGPDFHPHAVPDTHANTLWVCTVLNSVFFGWCLAAMTLESSILRPPLTHLPAMITHSCLRGVCVCVCTKSSHAEEETVSSGTHAGMCCQLPQRYSHQGKKVVKMTLLLFWGPKWNHELGQQSCNVCVIVFWLQMWCIGMAFLL